MINRTTLRAIFRTRVRSGFTLLELMIVIGLMGFLVVLTAVVYANFIALSKEQATAVTIGKLNKIIQQRQEAFHRLDVKSAALKMKEKDPFLSQRLAEIIIRKQRFQQAFPQHSGERKMFNGVDYSTYLSGTPYESSALLFLAINYGETFGAAAVDEDAFSSGEIQSVTVNTATGLLTIQYYVDAWGQPLRFYRWPTGLIRSAPGNAVDTTYAKPLITSLPKQTNLADDPLQHDPDDPLDAISSSTYLPWFRTNFHTEATFHTPLIVSPGPDRVLGLREPNDTLNLPFSSLALPLGTMGPLTDNITNLNQRNKGN